MIQVKRFRGQALDGTRRGPSNPYRSQIPSFAGGPAGEKLRFIADFAAPAVVHEGRARRTHDASQ
jgi:hypothetical protein